MTQESLSVFEQELSTLNQRTTPLEWASAKNNLGYKLITLEQKDSDIKALKRSIEDIEDKLQSCDPEKELEKWVNLQSDLASLLHTLGQRNTGATISILNESMEAYKSILPVIKRQDTPLIWSIMLHNIGWIFQDLGEYSKGSRMLERSISAYNNVLTQRTVESSPIEWALTQNNAAVSMQVLGEIKQDMDILKESIQSYDNANQKLTQEDHPTAWVITLANLAGARTILAEQTKDSELARQALSHFTKIVEFLRDTTKSQYLILAEQYRDNAQATLEKIGG